MINHYVRLGLVASFFVFIVWYLGAHLQGQQPKGVAVSYSCDAGKTLDAVYYVGAKVTTVKSGERPIPAGSVRVMPDDGRTMTLSQTISASGVRYANADESFIFWNKGHEVLVLEQSKEKDYVGCIEVSKLPAGSNLSDIYSSGDYGFSIRLPKGYTPDATYVYQMAPERNIAGVKFTIPASMADGTNLGHDTYLSIERIPKVEECTGSLFLYDAAPSTESVENNAMYSVATSTGAGAGNRYEETIYAIPGTSPCLAVRYFIHYSVFENYPIGAVRQWDRASLIKQFDQIRNSLVYTYYFN